MIYTDGKPTIVSQGVRCPCEKDSTLVCKCKEDEQEAEYGIYDSEA